MTSVTDRPASNGVFNENQSLKKSFLIQAGDGKGDPKLPVPDEIGAGAGQQTSDRTRPQRLDGLQLTSGRP